MRSYGQRGKGKNQHCGWGCCFHRIQGYIVFGRSPRKRNLLKRLFKSRARAQAKRDIDEQLETNEP